MKAENVPPAGRFKALAQLRRLLAEVGPGDVVMVTRLDRLARSTRDLLNTLAAITGKKAGFRSLADAWADTTTAHGRLMLTVLRRAERRLRSLERSARQPTTGTSFSPKLIRPLTRAPRLRSGRVMFSKETVRRFDIERRQSRIEAETRPAVGTVDRVRPAHIDVDVRVVLRWGHADALELPHPDADFGDAAVVPELRMAAVGHRLSPS
jgi:hypothetical protein